MRSREAIKKFFFIKTVRVVVSALLGLLIAQLISITPVGQNMESNLLDLQFRFSKDTHQPDTNIVILAIDQNSIQYFKRNSKVSWPWPRDFYALTTNYLSRHGAKAIVYDFHFNEPDEDRVISRGSDNDSLFAHAIQKAGDVFLSTQLTNMYEEDQPGDTLIRFPANQEQIHETEQFNFDKTYAPLLQFQRGARGIGVVNFIPDHDGVCRHMPILYHYKGKEIFSLPFEVYHSLYHSDQSIEEKLSSPYLIYWYGRGGPEGKFKYYSIHSVIVSAMKERFGLAPDLPPNLFKDKIVLIGSNAPGLLDMRPTPFTYLEAYPGVEIHATVLSNFIQRRFITIVPLGWLIMISLLAALGVAWISNYAENILTSSLAVILILGMYFFIAVQLFIHNLIWFKMVFPFGSILFSYVVSIGWSYATEGRSKRQIQKIFGQFVNPQIVKQLSQDPENVELGGEEVDATIMFSDIEGFTSISETKKPKELVSFLNEYFTAANEICFKHEGTIDKFIGDAVMVQFGIPLKNPNHRILAVRAAYEFSRVVNNMKKRALERGEPVFSTRIGINSGNMVVGYIGGHSKKEYTVIGDNVNLASRLEGVNKFYGTSVMVSESTANHLVTDEFLLREMDLIRVKGKSQPIKIYEVFCAKEELSEQKLQVVQTFESALKLYREQRWDDAVKLFSTVGRLKENDYASSMYIQRCKEFKTHPPAKNWDGVYVFKSK